MNTKFSFSNYIEITIAKKMPKNEVEIISFSMSSTRSPYLKALNSHFPVKLPLGYLFQIMHIIRRKTPLSARKISLRWKIFQDFASHFTSS